MKLFQETEVFMKMVRKYANMAFLLFSVAAVVPTYGNEEIITDNQEEAVIEPKEAEDVWYRRPVWYTTPEGISGAIVTVAAIMYAGAWYKGIVGSPREIFNKMRPLTLMEKEVIRGDNMRRIDFKVKKISQKYNDELALYEAYGCEIPLTLEQGFLEAIKSIYRAYGFNANCKLGDNIEGSRTLYTMISCSRYLNLAKINNFLFA